MHYTAVLTLIPYGSGTIPTLHWQRHDSRALLLFVPGGSGSFSVAQRRRLAPSWIFESLYQNTEFPVDIVFMDRWQPLYSDDLNWEEKFAARVCRDYMDQITTTVRYYQQRSLPMIAMGHSNGTLSLGQWLCNQGTEDFSALIFSASNFCVPVPSTFAVPSLVLHHSQDPCEVTPSSAADRITALLMLANRSWTDQRWVHGGQAAAYGKDTSATGYHMYFKAYAEAAAQISGFLVQAQQS